MAEKITAYVVGKLQKGSSLIKQSPEARARILLKEFKEIKEVDVITGEWDMLIRFEVDSLDQYYNTAWGIAKYLEGGWGALVTKKITP